MNHTTFYYYDSNNRLEQIKTESQTGTAYSNYNYSNNRITSVEHSNGSFLEYTYENNLIVKQVFYHNNLESVTLFEYGSANNMIVTDLGLCINTFEYDQNNNPVFINNCNSINYQFEYDTKKNPFLLVYPEYLLKIHPSGNNNATKYIYHDVIHDVMSTDIIVYEYNNENYPVKRMFYTENVLKATEEYFYSH
ncbi:MAG: hypothetical protein R2776_05225 [Flavobacteriaceae bacterium]|nr:hypothetical protein [Flavobacteriaceae bacterium]